MSIDPDTCKQFLGGIICGSRNSDQETVQISILALADSLVFLKPIINDKTPRDEIFKLLYNHINNEDFTEKSYQALFEFCKSAYDFLGEYLNFILEVVVNHMHQRNENTISALEVLDTIGTELSEKAQDLEGKIDVQHNIQNYLTPLQDKILPEIMSCLLIENSSDYEFSEMRNSAAKSLGTMVAIGNHETIQIVMNGVGMIIGSENVGHQQASAILLSTLCEYPDQDYAFKVISEAFDRVLGLLNSNEPIVTSNTLSGL